MQRRSSSGFPSNSRLLSHSATLHPDLSLLCLRHLLAEQGLWEIGHLLYWRHFLATSADELQWPPDPAGQHCPASRTPTALRSWFHAHCLPQWKRFRAHFPDDSDCSYLQICALMRERYGFPTGHVLPVHDGGDDWRQLRRQQARAQMEEAQLGQPDCLTLSMAYDLGSREERLAGTILSAGQVRQRLLECRNGRRPAPQPEEVDFKFDDFKMVARAAWANEQGGNLPLADAAELRNRTVTVFVIPDQQRRVNRLPETPVRPQLSLPQPRASIGFKPAPLELSARDRAVQRRAQLNALIAAGDRDRLLQHLERLTLAERAAQMHVLRRMERSQTQPGTGRLRLTPTQARLWRRQPLSGITGMMRGQRANRRAVRTAEGSDEASRARRRAAEERVRRREALERPRLTAGSGSGGLRVMDRLLAEATSSSSGSGSMASPAVSEWTPPTDHSTPIPGQTLRRRSARIGMSGRVSQATPMETIAEVRSAEGRTTPTRTGSSSSSSSSSAGSSQQTGSGSGSGGGGSGQPRRPGQLGGSPSVRPGC